MARVVITGAGTVNPLGHDVATTFAAMAQGRSAIGPLKNAVALAQVFIKGGVVAKLASRNTPQAPLVAPEAPVVFSGPLAILVDRGTAGAAEMTGRGPLKR